MDDTGSMVTAAAGAVLTPGPPRADADAWAAVSARLRFSDLARAPIPDKIRRDHERDGESPRQRATAALYEAGAVRL